MVLLVSQLAMLFYICNINVKSSVLHKLVESLPFEIVLLHPGATPLRYELMKHEFYCKPSFVDNKLCIPLNIVFCGVAHLIILFEF